jgi:signal transduction histidine kinase/ligand-binding sensor domain-containing protein/DNA-binding response OmpR family regulator
MIAASLVDRFGNLWFGTAGGGVSRFDGTNFTTFTTRHGLAHNTVRSILEDKRGNIWFGTNGGGLSRFDGTRFVTFTTEDGLTHNMVRTLAVDRRGNLWIGTEGGGASRFDGRNFTTFSTAQGLPHSTVWSIVEDKRGNLWFGTGAGLSRFDGNDFTTLAKKEGLVDLVVRCIAHDKRGQLWIGTNGGVSVYDGQRFKSISTEQGLVHNQIRSIVEDKNGNMWFGTEGGLSRFDGKNFINLTTQQGLKHNVIRTITEDRSGNLWFGTEGGGVSRYDGTNMTAYTTAQGLLFDVIRCVIEDSDGNMWFATQGGGVSRFDGKNFTSFTMDQGLANNEVWSMATDRNGHLWFGTASSGLSHYDGSAFTSYTTEHGLGNNSVRAIMEDRNGNLWFGTEGGGVSRYDGKNFTTFSTKEGLAHNDVRSIAEDSRGNLWFTTNGGGICQFDGRSFTTYTTTQGLPSNVVWSIEEDMSGSLWFGTGSGACRFDGKSFITFTTVQGLSDDVVYDIVEDEQGVLWFGTNAGISGLKFNVLEADGVGSKVKGAGLLDVGNEVLAAMSPVWDIYNTRTGYPVKSINLNAMCISKKGLPLGDSKGVGTIWSGCGDNKVIRFDPAVATINADKPDVFLQAIKIAGTRINWYGLGQWEKDSTILAQQESLIFGRLLTPTEREEINEKFKGLQFDSLSQINHLPRNLALPYRDNQVSFDFGVVETGRNFLVRYQYILEGYDKTWSPVTEKTSVTYGNIQEGSYEFKLKSRSPEGVWSDPVVYKFAVLPPWWRSGWAYTLYVVTFAIMIWIARRQIIKRERLKNEIKMKKLEADKYQELDSLKSRFFANISHEFRTPLTLLLSPLEKRMQLTTAPEDKEEFGIMHRNATRLLNLVNQLLDLSRIEAGSLKLKTVHGNINTFIKSISSQFSSIAQSREIHFEVISLAPIDAWFDPDKLEKIISNLLSNAFKFTPSGGNISVVSSIDQGHAKIEISDSGKGIPPEKIERIFDRFYQVDDSNLREFEGSGIGLSLVKELVELHHGTITVSSKPEQGSCFTVHFPLGKEHLADTEISESGEFISTAVMKVSAQSVTLPQPIVNEEIPRVLIVEDNEDLRNYLCLSLRERYNLIESANGQQALERAIQEIPDLILSDLMMPKMDGLELCREIKSNEKTSHIPVILLTAKTDQETRIDGFVIGADDYLAKPFSLPELTARINNLIETRKKLRKFFSSTIILKPSEIKVVSLDDRFIKKVMESIEAHLSNSAFGLELLADDVAMSTAQVYRKLKAITGQTPNDLIRNVRLERAASLLDQHVGNVTDVAYMVGFNNLSYFAKCFKEKFALNPSDYLKRNAVV